MSNLAVIPFTKESTIRALFGVALGVIVMFGIAVSFNNGSDPEPEKSALFMCGALLGSFYIFLGLVEISIINRLVNLKSSLLLWVLFVACLGYVARTKASVDINQIFHMEASIFPMTLVAAALLHMINFLFIFFFISGIICLLLAVGSIMQKGHYGRGFKLVTCQIVTGLAFLFIAGFSHFKIDRDRPRLQMIYRIAHAVDFNAHSPCANINSSTTSMVFLGADKRLALIAPVLDEFAGFEWRKVSFLRSVAVPENFETVMCDYTISIRNTTVVGTL